VSLGGVAFWGATLVQEGNVEGIFPWQLPKLRTLLAVSGAWLVFVGVAVLAGFFLRQRQAISESQTLSLRRLHPTQVALLLFILGHVTAYGWFVTQRHDRFNSTGYDLTIKEQVIWNTLLDCFFASSVGVENAFADYLQPVMLALIPLCVLFLPRLLLWVQVIDLAASATYGPPPACVLPVLCV
jgi:hypothetical protein